MAPKRMALGGFRGYLKSPNLIAKELEPVSVRKPEAVVSDDIDKRIQQAEQEARDRRAAATDALANAPAQAQALANDIEQRIKESLADLLPYVTPITAPMGRGASERVFILGTPGGFKVQFKIKVAWTSGTGYSIGWGDAKISASASLHGKTAAINVRVSTNTPSKTAIDFTALREDILRTADSLAR